LNKKTKATISGIRHCPRLHPRIMIKSPNKENITCPASWNIKFGQWINASITAVLISNEKNWSEYHTKIIQQIALRYENVLYFPVGSRISNILYSN
jgi:hypothetical protein